jgi:hypothetical protein
VTNIRCSLESTPIGKKCWISGPDLPIIPRLQMARESLPEVTKFVPIAKPLASDAAAAEIVHSRALREGEKVAGWIPVISFTSQ